MKITSALLLITPALAFPMVKRQSVVSSAVETITSAVETVAAQPSSSLMPISVMSSAIASAEPSSAASAAMSSAPAVGGLPVPASMSASSASASASMAPLYTIEFPCPSGFHLIYVEEQMNYNVDLETLVAQTGFSNNTMATGQTGGNDTIGATRMLSINGTMVTEMLVNDTVNPMTNAVYQEYNLTNGPVMFGSLSVANYSTNQQVYINDTETSPTAPVSTVKLFSNICVNTGSEGEGLSAFDAYLNSALAGYMTSLSGASASSAMSSAMPSMSAMSSMASGAMSSASAAVAPVPVPVPTPSDAASMASSATSMASEIASSASSVASSAMAAASSAAMPAAGAGGAASSAASSAMPSMPAMPAGAAGAVMVNTPASIVQCQPASITFSGGMGPYFLSVLPGGQPTATPLEQFAEQPVAGAYVWTVNLAAGTSVTLQVRDGAGNTNYSSPITIQDSDDASCLAATPSTSM